MILIEIAAGLFIVCVVGFILWWIEGYNNYGYRWR
jgi:hypothetical protein